MSGWTKFQTRTALVLLPHEKLRWQAISRVECVRRWVNEANGPDKKKLGREQTELESLFSVAKNQVGESEVVVIGRFFGREALLSRFNARNSSPVIPFAHALFGVTQDQDKLIELQLLAFVEEGGPGVTFFV